MSKEPSRLWGVELGVKGHYPCTQCSLSSCRGPLQWLEVPKNLSSSGSLFLCTAPLPLLESPSAHTHAPISTPYHELRCFSLPSPSLPGSGQARTRDGDFEGILFCGESASCTWPLNILYTDIRNWPPRSFTVGLSGPSLGSHKVSDHYEH